MSEKTIEDFLIDKSVLPQNISDFFVGYVVSYSNALLAVKKAQEEGFNRARFHKARLLNDDVKGIKEQARRELLKKLEDIFLKNKGDCDTNFHTFLIKDYEKLKEASK